MSNKSCIILTHQFLGSLQTKMSPSFQIDDNLKLNIFFWSLKHFRLHNPSSYIIVVGHGNSLPNVVSKYADHVIWHENIVENQINNGHPRLILEGLRYAQAQGFEYALKTRIDSINLFANITDVVFELFDDSRKNFLTTAYRGDCFSLMDLFNFWLGFTLYF